MPTTFNTTDPKPGYVYDTATDTWFPLLGIAPGSSIVRWRFTAVGAETSVSGLDDLSATLSYNAGTEQVYLNGVLLVRTADYTATTGTSVTGLTALAASDVIEVISFNATNVQITDALLETDINAKGDLIVGAAIDTAAILTSGTNGQVLSVNTATATGLAWITSDDANAIQNAIVDAKGDLIVGTAADTVGRLAVGTNGYFLSADSSAGTGLAWAAPAAAGGMTLINTGGTALTSTGVTISSIPGTHKHLYISVKNAYNSAIDSLYFRLNGDTGSNYTYTYSEVRTSTFSGGGGTGTSFSIVSYMGTSSGALNEAFFDMWIPNYTDTNGVFMNSRSIGRSNYQVTNVNGIYANTAAITSVTIYPQSGTFSGGTAYVYGVS